MTKRTRINLFAALIVAGGGASLYDASPVQAADVLDPCDNLAAAKAEAQAWCTAHNGTYVVEEAYCTATGYGLKTRCIVPMY